ncbi:MAG TPA: acyl-CoA dehydrogenase family protein [Xanthobacteraceae bacterium]|nr:acyl-CoA dehydrogenase family protein [Xanthobacteraceae bacterium]
MIATLDNDANQPPPYADVNLYSSDRALIDAVAANGAKAEAEALAAFGGRWGSAEMFEQARFANADPPRLDAETVNFHPAYHRFMAESIGAGLHASTWRDDATPAGAPSEVARAARFYMVAQVENGHQCPITMTRASVAALAAEPALAKRLVPRILGREYDPAFRPWWEKSTITLGMGMTEKQGGTDVRANTTWARPEGEGYLITGHKWFMSAPMCDGFLVLAQTKAGLTCFFLPRFRPDGGVNALHFQRLKDKLGNRSNASAEVEFTDAFAYRVGEEGKGISTILQMVQLTRVDCAIASAGMMRMGLAQAVHHCRHRKVFGKHLVEQPMMRTVLADMTLTVEAAVALVMRLCRAFDLAPRDPAEAARARLLTPAVKYWVCKTAPRFIYEAMECLGGNGYVEDSVMPRLYREAPVNAIWEGSGNVMCLDVLRACAREEGARGVLAELERESRDLPGAVETAAAIAQSLTGTNVTSVEANARAVVERLAQLAAAAALATGAPAAIAAAFARTALAEGRAPNYGAAALEERETALLLDRALPP